MILSFSENMGLCLSVPSDNKHQSIKVFLPVIRYRHKLLEPGNIQDVLHEVPTIRCQQSHRNEGGSCREIITRLFSEQSPGETHHTNAIWRSTQVWQREWNLLHAHECTSASNTHLWETILVGKERRKKPQANQLVTPVRYVTYL